MKTISIETELFGIKANLPGVESIAEYNKLAKSETAALDTVNKFEAYHNTLGQWRKNLDTVVQVTTKVAPKTKPHPTKAGATVRAESPIVYIERVIAEGKLTVEALTKLAADTESGKTPILGSDGKQLVVDGKPQFYTIVFDPSESEAGPRNVEPTKGDLAKAVELRKHPESAKKIASLAKLSGQPVTPASTDKELANAYGIHRRNIERAAKVEAMKKADSL